MRVLAAEKRRSGGQARWWVGGFLGFALLIGWLAMSEVGHAAAPYQLPGVTVATLARFHVELEAPPPGSLAGAVGRQQAETAALAAAPNGQSEPSIQGAVLAWVAGPANQPHRNLLCWVVALSTNAPWPGPWGGVNPAVAWGAPPTVTGLVILVDAQSGEALEMMVTGTRSQ
jgi:hypothetical protein